MFLFKIKENNELKDIEDVEFEIIKKINDD